MATNQVMAFCKKCDKKTIHLQPSTSHVLHLILSLITFGVWVIIWFIVAASNNSQKECSVCGRSKGLFGT